METVVIEKDINVYCVTAKSFPDGILDAHKQLHGLLPSKERKFFGLSRPENGTIIYKAAAEVLAEDNLDVETYVIKKGHYRCITVLNFMKDHQGIGRAFSELTSDPDIDPNGYCLEYYYNDEDVTCMVRLKDR
ncbi:transcriptional regulator [Bacillus tuaregi]|uniref:transcriptional regulator n=1 Tax=Bacillus tuaregi TaxID=1816695 RepID=UPI0008F9692B|nr:transcriptional regulator [Bacillus tuaregi]